MSTSLPVRVVAVLYLVAQAVWAVQSCGGPTPIPSPAMVPATPLPMGALQVSHALLPVVLGWPSSWLTRTPTPAATRVLSARERLIAEVVGFARVRGVDGAGTRGAACVVTNMGNAGPGTLADCLSRPGRWITFSTRGRIVLGADLDVPSSTTIDAGGAGVELWGHGLVMRRSENVIISGLAITECAEDAIQIREHAAGIFLTGLVLSRCGDGLVDITDGSTDVTLANSTLRDHVKAMLIGASDDHSADTVTRVTITNTIFATVYRHPLCRYGYVHLDRVTIGPWAGEAVDARFGCRVLITRSWFVPGTGDKPRKAAARFFVPEAPGAIRIDAATDLAGQVAEVGGAVEDPPYRGLP